MDPKSRRLFLRHGLALGTGGLIACTGETSAAKTEPYADAVLVKGEPPPPQAGAFTIAVLPDTQHYSAQYPDIYLAQTKWIVEQQKARNIACVLHLGDITNNNTVPQWENAAKAMKELEGKVPCFMAPGNHDYGPNGNCATRDTMFHRYFKPAAMRAAATFGGFYDHEPERVENSYHLFSAAGRNFVVLCLEFGPRKDVVRWANEVVAKHKDREAILVTHAFIYDDDTRYDFKKHGTKQTWNPHSYGMAKVSKGDVTDGEELWDLLMSRHRNFIFTINGHVLHDGLGRVTTADPGGREIPQMLVNFQMRPRGGDGWLRLLELRADGSMHVCDYSPVRGERNESGQNKFSVKLAGIA